MVVVACAFSALSIRDCTLTLGSCVDDGVRRVDVHLVALALLDCLPQEDTIACAYLPLDLLSHRHKLNLFKLKQDLALLIDLGRQGIFLAHVDHVLSVLHSLDLYLAADLGITLSSVHFHFICLLLNQVVLLDVVDICIALNC